MVIVIVGAADDGEGDRSARIASEIAAPSRCRLILSGRHGGGVFDTEHESDPGNVVAPGLHGPTRNRGPISG